MSKLALCNLALLKLGVDPIVTLTENTKAAKLCTAMYENLRKALLRNYNWGFALSRASLITAVMPSPAWGYGNAFTLPSDCLKVIQAEDPYTEYKVESNLILTDDSDINILYVRDEDDTDAMPEDFKNALALYLAANMALPLIKDRNLHIDMQNLFRDSVKEIRSIDAQEKGHSDFFVDTWLDSRVGSNVGPGDRSYYWN